MPSCQSILSVLVSITMVLGAAGGFAPASRADPNPFSTLSCDCQSPPSVDPGRLDQITQGIRDALASQADLHALRLNLWLPATRSVPGGRGSLVSDGAPPGGRA